MNKNNEIKGKRICYWGTEKNIIKAEEVINHLELTGNEEKDRLVIQEAIDKNNLKCAILYDGNTVYPFKSIVNELDKMRKTNSIKNISNEMYHFLMNFDIAHYDKKGYIAEYDGSYLKMMEVVRNQMLQYPLRFSDVRKIVNKHLMGN